MSADGLAVFLWRKLKTKFRLAFKNPFWNRLQRTCSDKNHTWLLKIVLKAAYDMYTGEKRPMRGSQNINSNMAFRTFFSASTLQQKSHLCIPEGTARPQTQFPQSCVYEWFIYSQLSVHLFSCSKIGRPIMGIYKSLTDTWMWKLGLRPHNSFSGNICFEFSVLCLCTVNFFKEASTNLIFYILFKRTT
jgi:hypothetical protein